jgi:hypothetical protein
MPGRHYSIVSRAARSAIVAAIYESRAIVLTYVTLQWQRLFYCLRQTLASSRHRVIPEGQREQLVRERLFGEQEAGVQGRRLTSLTRSSNDPEMGEQTHVCAAAKKAKEAAIPG